MTAHGQTVLRLAAIAALVACREATQISVVVTTDVLCSDHPSAAVVVGTLAELDAIPPKPLSSQSVACDSGRLGTLVIVPGGGSDSPVAFKVVEGFAGRSAESCIDTGDYAGCIVARRSLRYLPHTRLTVPVTMRLDCKGIPCGASTTCVAGACVPASIGDPSACARPGGCAEDTLADGGAPDAGSTACVGACFTKIAAGGDFTCALSTAGVMCWGNNSCNELGRGSSGLPDSTPRSLRPPLNDAVGITAKHVAICAERPDGSILCWGEGSGLKEAGRTTAPGVPTLLFPAGTRQVALSADAACWRTPTGVACAGDNVQGELAAGDTSARAAPVSVTLPPGAVLGLVGAAQNQCVVMRDAGATSLWCWGRNSWGQVVPGNPPPTVTRPTKIDLSSVGELAAVAGCNGNCAHFCVVLGDTTVACWGANVFGQVGLDPAVAGDQPPKRVRVAPGGALLTGATQLALGEAFSCALVGSKVKCWGLNSAGQLGRGGPLPDAGAEVDPLAGDVVGIGPAKAVAAGEKHACALLENGELWCWGDNAKGALGGTNLQSVTAPQRVVVP